MKNKWLRFADGKGYLKQVNLWLQSIWNGNNPNALGNALYDITNLVYNRYEIDFIPLVEKDDIVQECIVDLLKLFNNQNTYDNLFETLFETIIKTVDSLTSGVVAKKQDVDKLAKKLYQDLKSKGIFNN